MKEQLLVISMISVPISVLFFVISLFCYFAFYDVLNNNVFISLVPILLGTCCLCLTYLKTFHFRNMIRVQEKNPNVSIDEESLTPLYPQTLFYSSNSWFIKSGCWAFHKASLKKIKVRVAGKKIPGRHYVVEFHTIEGSVITDRTMHSGEIQKLKEWHNHRTAGHVVITDNNFQAYEKTTKTLIFKRSSCSIILTYSNNQTSI